MKVSEAIKVLGETYMSLDAVALGLDVDQKEVETAFAKAKEDTTEYICLQALMKKFAATQNNTIVQELVKDGSQEQQ